MAFWGEEKWLAAQTEKSIIDDFRPASLREGTYRLRLGDEAIVSSSVKDKRGAYRKLSPGSVLSLEPGHFAYLITKESISIPADAIGLINVATAEKFNGLINISGFHADPLYSGKLIFTVFNAGPLIIPLSADEELFRLWLSDFAPAATKAPALGYTSLDKKWVSRLQGVYPSSFALAMRVHQLEAEVKRIVSQRFFNYLFLTLITLILGPFAAAMFTELFKRWWN